MNYVITIEARTGEFQNLCNSIRASYTEYFLTNNCQSARTNLTPKSVVGIDCVINSATKPLEPRSCSTSGTNHSFEFQIRSKVLGGLCSAGPKSHPQKCAINTYNMRLLRGLSGWGLRGHRKLFVLEMFPNLDRLRDHRLS